MVIFCLPTATIISCNAINSYAVVIGNEVVSFTSKTILSKLIKNIHIVTKKVSISYLLSRNVYLLLVTVSNRSDSMNEKWIQHFTTLFHMSW